MIQALAVQSPRQAYAQLTLGGEVIDTESAVKELGYRTEPWPTAASG